MRLPCPQLCFLSLILLLYIRNGIRSCYFHQWIGICTLVQYHFELSHLSIVLDLLLCNFERFGAKFIAFSIATVLAGEFPNQCRELVRFFDFFHEIRIHVEPPSKNQIRDLSGSFVFLHVRMTCVFIRTPGVKQKREKKDRFVFKKRQIKRKEAKLSARKRKLYFGKENTSFRLCWFGGKK